MSDPCNSYMFNNQVVPEQTNNDYQLNNNNDYQLNNNNHNIQTSSFNHKQNLPKSPDLSPTISLQQIEIVASSQVSQTPWYTTSPHGEGIRTSDSLDFENYITQELDVMLDRIELNKKGISKDFLYNGTILHQDFDNIIKCLGESVIEYRLKTATGQRTFYVLMLGQNDFGKSTTMATLETAILKYNSIRTNHFEISSSRSTNPTIYFGTIETPMKIGNVLVYYTDFAGINIDSFTSKDGNPSQSNVILELFRQKIKGEKYNIDLDHFINKSQIDGVINEPFNQYNMGVFVLKFDVKYFKEKTVGNDTHLVFLPDEIEIKPTMDLLSEMMEKKISTTIVVTHVRNSGYRPQDIINALSNSTKFGASKIIIHPIDKNLNLDSDVTQQDKVRLYYLLWNILYQADINCTKSRTRNSVLKSLTSFILPFTILMVILAFLVGLYQNYQEEFNKLS